MSLGLRLRIIGRPGRIGALERFLDYVKTKPDIWSRCAQALPCILRKLFRYQHRD